MGDQSKMHIKFQILFFILGILYLIILPPFTAPDEAGHFATAYHYANILCGNEDVIVHSDMGNDYYQIVMREQDAALYERLAPCGEKGCYSVWEDFLRKIRLSIGRNVPEVQSLCKTMPYIFVLYVPAVTAILICRMMGLDSVIMVYLARFLTFLAAWYMISKAFKRIPSACQKIFQVIILFSMVIHLLSSCSADAVMIAAAVYGSALILCYRQTPVKLRRTDGIVIAVMLGVVALSKPFYILYFVMGLLVPQETFERKGAYYLFCLIPLFCWLWKYLPIVFACISEGDVSVYADLSKGYSLEYILGHPVETAQLMLRSIRMELPYIGAQCIGLYLGPLTVRIPSAAVAIYMALLLLAVFCDDEGQQIVRGKSRIMVVFLFAFTYLCCYGMDLLWWTPFGANKIEGVQGRYLLPVLGILCVALKPARTVKPKWLHVGMYAMLGLEVLTHSYVLTVVFCQLS